jgi:hypothetical protein
MPQKRQKRPKPSVKTFSLSAAAVIMALCLVLAVGLLTYLATTHIDNPPQVPKKASKVASTANWRRVDSIGATFSLRLPDGWWLDNYAGNVMNGDRIVYEKGELATVTSHPDQTYSGSQKKFNVTLNSKPLPAPQWQAQAVHGTSSTSDFNVGSLKGKRYSVMWNENFVVGVYQRDDVTQGTVFYRGDRIYQYVFDVPGGRQLTVVYNLPATDKDNLAQVEQVVRSILVK